MTTPNPLEMNRYIRAGLQAELDSFKRLKESSLHGDIYGITTVEDCERLDKIIAHYEQRITNLESVEIVVPHPRELYDLLYQLRDLGRNNYLLETDNPILDELMEQLRRSM